MKKQTTLFMLLTLGLLALVALRVVIFSFGPTRSEVAWRLRPGRTETIPWLDFDRKPAEEEVKNRPIQVREKGYVSSKTCQSCHPHEHATWHSSYHRTMTQVATPEAVIGDFDGKLRSCRGKDYRLGRDDDEFWVEITEPGKAPERKEIVMTTGSHHMQAYWFASGDRRKLGLVPLVYLNLENEKPRWVEEYATFLHDAYALPHYQAEGKWNKFCRQCHATGVQPWQDDMDTRMGELGIACEACHGPAEEHVRFYRDPSRRYTRHLAEKTGDTTPIVNPVGLSPKKASQVCGQCHSILETLIDEHKKELEGGFTYRPGEDLAETRPVISGKDMDTREKKIALIQKMGSTNFIDDRYWSDGMIRIAGREYNGLVDSPCYKHDDPGRTLTCMSCHRMHKREGSADSIRNWRDDQLDEGMRTNQACLQCHEDLGKNISEHTHHAPGSSGSLCYNCHMPHTTYGLLKGIRSHTISVPSVQESLQTGRPNACNACHLDKTLLWSAKHLFDWYKIKPPPSLKPGEQKIAASVLWLLRGDAGQRALMAWAMGWKPAQEVSKTNWMAPYLGQLMQGDPYPAVRYIAQHSLRTIEGYRSGKYDGEEYDYMGPANLRVKTGADIYRIWEARGVPLADRKGALLIDKQGKLAQNVWEALLKNRNNRRVNLEE